MGWGEAKMIARLASKPDDKAQKKMRHEESIFVP